MPAGNVFLDEVVVVGMLARVLTAGFALAVLPILRLHHCFMIATVK